MREVCAMKLNKSKKISLLLLLFLFFLSACGNKKLPNEAAVEKNENVKQIEVPSDKKETKIFYDELLSKNAQCKDPEQALEEYYDAIIKGDREKALTYLYKGSYKYNYIEDAIESSSNELKEMLDGEWELPYEEMLKSVKETGLKYEERSHIINDDNIKRFVLEDSFGDIHIVYRDDTWLIAGEQTIDFYQDMSQQEAKKKIDNTKNQDFICIPIKYSKLINDVFQIKMFMYNYTDKNIGIKSTLVETTHATYESKRDEGKIDYVAPDCYTYNDEFFFNKIEGDLLKLHIIFEDDTSVSIPLKNIFDFSIKKKFNDVLRVTDTANYICNLDRNRFKSDENKLNGKMFIRGKGEILPLYMHFNENEENTEFVSGLYGENFICEIDVDKFVDKHKIEINNNELNYLKQRPEKDMKILKELMKYYFDIDDTECDSILQKHINASKTYSSERNEHALMPGEPCSVQYCNRSDKINGRKVFFNIVYDESILYIDISADDSIY